MSTRDQKKALSAEQRSQLLKTLEARFEKHMHRHKGIDWSSVRARLDSHPAKWWPLFRMEETGGEPDVVGIDKDTGGYLFFDCSEQSPKDRRNVCYDPDALAARKEHKPPDSALGMAADMGISLLTEAQYHDLQRLGEFDTKTSSWIITPAKVRKLGGGLFCDRRYDTVFVYHNGAESYYAARGFRGCVMV